MTKLVLTQNGDFLDFHCFEHKDATVNTVGFASTAATEIDRFLSAAAIGGRPGIYATGSNFQQIVNREAFFRRVQGAEILNPFRAIKCQVTIDEQQLQDYSMQLAVAVGLSWRGTE